MEQEEKNEPGEEEVDVQKKQKRNKNKTKTPPLHLVFQMALENAFGVGQITGEDAGLKVGDQLVLQLVLLLVAQHVRTLDFTGTSNRLRLFRHVEVEETLAGSRRRRSG